VVRTSKDLSRVFYLDPDRLQSFSEKIDPEDFLALLRVRIVAVTATSPSDRETAWSGK